MKLTSTDGAAIELRPLDYQVPEQPCEQAPRLDANWLLIRGDVRLPDERRWHFEDPCLTTWEAAELARWLRSVAAGAVEASPFPADEEHPWSSQSRTSASASRRPMS